MGDQILSVMTSWAASNPAFKLMLLLIGFDFLTGTLKAIKDGHLNSSVARDGLIKKFAECIAPLFGKALDPFAGGVPISEIIALSVVYAEGLSIIENLGLLGVPIPDAVRDALAKLPTAGRGKT